MFERINSDVNGNPRFVVHFLDLEAPENREAKRAALTLEARYQMALKAARKLGGKKYHTKHYGGGVVFQAYEFQLPGIIARVRELGAT
jgi:hypothetical protein